VVFLASQDWKTRALLRAQLLEEGVRVEADSTVEAAVARLEASAVLPGLLIADAASSDHPSADVERLRRWAKRVPIWLIASHALNVSVGLEPGSFEAILYLPLDMGVLVRQIKERVQGGM
jgi:DNA-binding response OmpR family regulator